MRIGINARFLSRSVCGNLIYITNLIKGLSKYDSKNEYVLFVSDEKSKNVLNINSKNIRYTLIDSKKYKFKSDIEWDFNFTNTKEFKQENLDLLHCTHFAIPNMNNKQALSNNMKIVVSIHDVIPSKMFRLKSFIEMGYPIPDMSLNGFYMRFKEAKMLKNADYVITFSNYVKKDLLNFFSYPEEKISVIPHFASSEFKIIDKNDDKKSRKILMETKKKFKLPRRFIVYFSGYHRRKNLKRLLKAFKKITNERNDIYLVLTGTGNLKEKIEKQSPKNIIFTGKTSRNELTAIINLSEFTITPSLYEGFGLMIIESMKCGKICLTSKNTPMEEIAGDSTLYFNPKNEEKIYKCIKKILNEPTLRKNLEEKVKTRLPFFREEKHIKDTIFVYDKFRGVYAK